MPSGRRSPEPAAKPRRNLHGRRKGKALRAGQKALVRELLPRLRLDLDEPPPKDLKALFKVPVSSCRLEIGFGAGEHLADMARRNPDVGIIGCEPFINGMASLLRVIEQEGLHNVRLWDGDGRDLVEWLPAGSLERIYLLYPDPWPKRRQRKRRFVSQQALDEFARLIVPGGTFRFATDIADYTDWTLRLVLAHGAFQWQARRAADWREPWPQWPGTRYEAKAIAAGRRPCYLTFKRG